MRGALHFVIFAIVSSLVYSHANTDSEKLLASLLDSTNYNRALKPDGQVVVEVKPKIERLSICPHAEVIYL